MKNSRRVVITGMGIIAGNGNNKEQFFTNCVAGISGIKKCDLFETNKLRTPYFGQVGQKISNPEKVWEDEDRMEVLVRIALEEMYKDADITKEDIKSKGSRARICVGTLLSESERLLQYAKDEKNGNTKSSRCALCVGYGKRLREISGVQGGIYVDTAACSASTTSIGMAYDFIKNDLCDVVIAGGADALTEASAYGFHSLQSLSMGICNPFDKNRDGINIGEGSAFFFLESLDSALKRQVPIYGEILGYGINNDAYHITSPDPEGSGAIASMNQAMQQGDISIEEIDFVNAHGTGTLINDEMECKALEKIFSDQKHTVGVQSTKALVGHCMGGSGAVELAAVLLCMNNNITFPMPELKDVQEHGANIEIISNAQKREMKHVLSNSFAFAGNTASLLIGKYEDNRI